MSDEPEDLRELLSENQILLPGTEIFLGFLTTLPFTDRFEHLSTTEHDVFVCGYFATLSAFVMMVAPAAYHRIARPIADKERFRVFANKLLVMGLVPLSISIVLTTFLVTSMVVGARYALWGALGTAVLELLLWWTVPFLRLHERIEKQKGRA